MKFGYARTSKLEQNLDLQIDELKKAGCEKIITDKISGSVAERPGLAKLKEQIRPNEDVIVVWHLDRLGRSLKHLIDQFIELEKNGIEFQSLHRFGKLNKFEDCEIDLSDIPLNFINHCHELAKRYDAWEIKRFYPEKRYSLLSIFLSESQKTLFDSLVLMYDQFIQKMLRETKNIYEKQQRLYRKKIKLP